MPFPKTIESPQDSLQLDVHQLKNLVPYVADSIQATGNNSEATNALPQDSLFHLLWGSNLL